MYYLQCKPVIDSILIYRQGDVNGDGKVNAKDALCILTCTINPAVLPIEN